MPKGNNFLKFFVFFIVIFIIAISMGLYYLNNRKNNTVFNESTYAVTNSPTPDPILDQEVKQAEVKSIYGELTLVMKAKKIGDGFTQYLFYVSDNKNNTEKLIFTKKVQSPGVISLPANSWSPDDKYFFIQETSNGVTDSLVFKADGEVFASGEQFLDILSLFESKKINYYITDVTGWDSPILVHVETAVDSAKKGPSFWFDVTSKSFIQLATR